MARRRPRSAVVERVSASIRKPEVENGSAPAVVLHEQPPIYEFAAPPDQVTKSISSWEWTRFSDVNGDLLRDQPPRLRREAKPEASAAAACHRLRSDLDPAGT
jgi:hypothetical protein